MIIPSLLLRTRNRHFVRFVLAILTITGTVMAASTFAESLRADGTNPAELLLIPLFVILFAWVSFSFWTATLGFVALVLKNRPRAAATSKDARSLVDRPRTAILMPIYNESTVSVFAGVEAMSRSLQDAGSAKEFDLFILSDTTHPEVWLDEERTWAKMAAELAEGPRLYYRRRSKNTGRKSGNIADFCRRWGALYEYMIVLDADSLMVGETMAEMVRRMDADERLGILQIPPAPINRMSLFARLQQFASRVYGPIFLQGFASWAQFDSNYWGHNAIIRVLPFMRHCSLPILPGTGPLSGEILSHDFVEAALMTRAGWRVGLADDLGGSYEECPTTLIDFAKRDQRWCQGNLQHIRLVFSEGFRPISRFHLATGVMSYLASPLWVLFMLTGAASVLWDSIEGHSSSLASNAGLGLFAMSMAMLLLPKLWSVFAMIGEPHRVEVLGGWKNVVCSMLLETALSMLLAPILMLFHSWFVLTTFRGHTVQWNAQRRDDGEVSLLASVSSYAVHTLIGIGLTTLIYLAAPGMLPWYLPIMIGLVLSIPLSLLVGSVTVGKRLSAGGLLRIPEEATQPPIVAYQVQAAERLRKSKERVPSTDLLRLVLNDPVFFSLHNRVLTSTGETCVASMESIERVHASRTLDELEDMPAEIRLSVLSDPSALLDLHIRARLEPRFPAIAS